MFWGNRTRSPTLLRCSWLSSLSGCAFILGFTKAQYRNENKGQKDKANCVPNAFPKTFRKQVNGPNAKYQIEGREDDQENPPPWLAYDVKKDKQVVYRYNGGPSWFTGFLKNTPDRH